MIKFIELFAGIGGFRYGLEMASTSGESGDSVINEGKTSLDTREFSCIYANDIDRYASAIYRYHWNDGTMHEGNIREVTAESIPDHDLICAGFPCQSFSIAGKRGGFEDTRGTLFFEIARIARIKRPRYLFLENVKGLLSHDEGNTFATIISTLDELGYDCEWQVLNSKNHGVPQNRERVFIIGNLRGTGRTQVFPIGENADIPDELCRETQGKGKRIRDEDNRVARHLRLGGSGVQDNLVSATDSSRYGKDGSDCLIQVGLVGEKDNMGQRIYDIDGIACSQRSQGGGQGAKTGLYEIPETAQSLQTDGQLRSGTSWDTNKPQSARNIRRLTPIECERLQGFPDNWTKYGIDKNGKQITISDSQRYKCCGNAVTTNVIKDIAIVLIRR